MCCIKYMSNNMLVIFPLVLPPLSPVHAQYIKYNLSNYSIHGKHMQVFNTDTSVQYWIPTLVLIISSESVCSTCSE